MKPNDPFSTERIGRPRRRGLVARVILFLTRRKVGRVPTPMQVMAHQPALLTGYARMELAQMKMSRVPASLKALASIRTSTVLGCPY
jgi:alkylhydroperoxidase family enzyme